MAKRWLIGTLTTSVFLWLAATGLQGAKPSGALPLNVDFGSATTTSGLSTTANGLYGDGDGLYIDGVRNVRAEIVGNFVFDTNDNARLDLSRRLVLNFRDQDVPLPVSPDGSYFVDVFIGTIGVTGVAAEDGDLRTMTANQDLNRRARIGWIEGTKSYSLRWDNTVKNVLRFHCDFGAPCQQWTMTPDGPAMLYSISSGKKPTETYIGSYNMPFSAILTPQ